MVIAGATGTGKTALSLELATRIGGLEIISADSRQVFRGLDIGTAKVDAATRAAVPHHGLDLVDPDAPFTAADFQRHADAALGAIAARDGVACLVGGTGLYLRAIARGLPLESGSTDVARRAELETRLATDGVAPLAAELRARDPAAAERIDLANPRRVVRALERLDASGSAAPPPPRGYPAPLVWLGVERDPGEHRELIAARAAEQFASGLLDEAAALRERYDPGLPAFSAIGYHEAFAVLAGETDLAGAIERDAARNRAFARRQRTWFRSEAGITWLDGAALDLGRVLELIEPVLEGRERRGYAGPR